MPWVSNAPIADVSRQVYSRHPRVKTSMWVSVRYVGPGLVREERYSTMSRSDTPEKPKRRWSKDNGATWSDFETLPEVVTHPQGVRVYWDGGAELYDPAAKAVVSIWLRQTHLKGVYYNQLFSRLSRDMGRTWSAPRQLTYEAGDAFDPAEPFKPGFLQNNQAYIGNNTIRHSNGTLIHAGAGVNIPKGVPIPNPKRLNVMGIPADARSIGSVCFIGTWDETLGDYRWAGGKPVWVSREVSSRGLMEPEVAELTGGRVLVVWRTSNASLDVKERPGHKYYSVSTDGGRTLTEPKPWTYDDGVAFYSPSSIHRMFRHTVTGKLYWIGNISPGPAHANSPRYPLVIAEVDEKIPAIKRRTVSLIDDRREGESDRLQLSNFSLLENREDHSLEIYLTRLGENTEDFWGADAYKYTLGLK
ncbi:MAG: exo-alpha-sialidase [Phycisphaerae bacterium]|nr:exo-alpha-sialidase [Phycisphaerae bacterium]